MNNHVTSRELTINKGTTPPIMLKPCPFCGDIAVLVPRKLYNAAAYMVECCRCHTSSMPIVIGWSASFNGKPSTFCNEEQAQLEACSRWNRRKEEAFDNEQATA